MKTNITLILIVVSLTLSGCKSGNRLTGSGSADPGPSGNSPISSGVAGTITYGPTAPGGTPAYAPYQATVAVLDAANQPFTTFSSGADGRYLISLPPGIYTFMPEPPAPAQPFPVAAPVLVKLGDGERQTVNILFDSGIR